MRTPLAEMSNEEVLDTYGIAVRRSLDYIWTREVRVELLRRIEQPEAVAPKPFAGMTADELRMEYESLHEETEAFNSRSREVFREWQCKYDFQETPQ